MSEQKVKSALVQAFTSGNPFFPLAQIQFENVSFVPPTDKPWAALWFIPNQRTVATLGSIGTDRVTGVFQIDLNYPLNNGDKDVSDKATAITSLLKVGYRAVYSGVEVVIASCGRSPGKVVGSFFRVSVTIAFYADINR
jgi:hypothetical protein